MLLTYKEICFFQCGCWFVERKMDHMVTKAHWSSPSNTSITSNTRRPFEWFVKKITNFGFYPVQKIPSHPKRLFNGKRRTLQSWWWPSCDVPQHSASIIQCWEAADLFWEGGKHPPSERVRDSTIWARCSALYVCVKVCVWVGRGRSRWGLLTELELSFHTGEFISLDLPVSLPFLHTQHSPPPPAALFMLWCRSEPERGTAKNKVRCDSCVNEHTRVFVRFFSPLFALFFFGTR